MTAPALAPEHLADLKASGLTEDTIAALRFEAVRPADITAPGALSAHRLPYFNLDGSKNCFERLRLVPPVTDENGKKQSIGRNRALLQVSISHHFRSNGR